MKRTVCIDGQTVRYTLVSSERYPEICVEARPGGHIQAYAPRFVALRAVDAAVRDQWATLSAQQRSWDTPPSMDAWANGATLLLEGRPARIVLEAGPTPRVLWQADTLYITAADLSRPAEVRNQVRTFLAQKTLERVRATIRRYEGTIRKQYGRITVREQRTRWGSCSSKRNLNFNWKLMMAPPEALTYVVVHELCHLLHFNHSRRFWAEVAARQPAYACWKEWLTTHGRTLDLP